MADPMTDPRALIEAATPLPWGQIDHPLGQIVAGPPKSNGKRNKVALTPGMTPEGVAKADAALIVYAVNNLPALLDVADLFEKDRRWWHNHLHGGRKWDTCSETSCTEAREALDRLKESTDD